MTSFLCDKFGTPKKSSFFQTCQVRTKKYRNLINYPISLRKGVFRPPKKGSFLGPKPGVTFGTLYKGIHMIFVQIIDSKCVHKMTDSRRPVKFWQKPEKSLFDVFAIFAKTGQKMTKTSGFHIGMHFSEDPVWEGGSSSYERGHLFLGVQNRVQNRVPLFDPFLFQNRVNF